MMNERIKRINQLLHYIIKYSSVILIYFLLEIEENKIITNVPASNEFILLIFILIIELLAR